MTATTDAFLAAAADGVLLIQDCERCGAAQLPPRLRCASCGAGSLHLVAATGCGRLASFTVLHRAPTAAHRERLPYVYALIDLDEGVRLISNVVDCDPGELRIGARLQVRFPPTADDEESWPVFVPAPPKDGSTGGG